MKSRMSCIQYAAQVIISNINVEHVRHLCLEAAEDFINVWSCSAQECSDSFITLFESSERIRVMTQGKWSLPDNSIMYVPFYYAVGKYIEPQVI